MHAYLGSCHANEDPDLLQVSAGWLSRQSITEAALELASSHCSASTNADRLSFAMRIRLSTTLPLPPLKAWYLLPRSVETISELKAQLVADLAAFKGIKPRLLAFEVDGFEVLDASRCEVLNEERDVLW